MAVCTDTDCVKERNKVAFCKYILFRMWLRVERYQDGSRSFVGDTALEMKDALYPREEEALFWEEYGAWRDKQQ